MLKKFFLKLSFCFGFLTVGANAFALDFTLERDGDRYENGYDCIAKKLCFWRKANPIFQNFMGEVGLPRGPHETVQWMAFKIKTQNLFQRKPHGSNHLVFATRGLLNGLESYTTKLYLAPFKGIFIGLPGYGQTDLGINKDIINCNHNSISRIYWEFRFLNMTLTRPNYRGFIPNYTPPNYPVAFPSGGFVTCADRDKYESNNENGLEERLNDHLQDGVTYAVLIHSAPDGMAYWIYREDGTLFFYKYIADDDFPSMFQFGVGDFYNQYVKGQSWWKSGYYIYSRSNNKSGEVSMSDVKRDPFASQYVDMQYKNRMIGIVPVIFDDEPWKIEITGLSSGWFVP